MSESRKTNFLKLVSGEKGRRIVIPGIQREYAQGRCPDEKAESVRKKFLPELVDVALGLQKDGLLLDYVYGIEKDGVIIPLDGQQRLTTLMLLHWYYGVHLPEKCFSYKMRRKADVFTNELLKHDRVDFKRDPVSQIKSADWYNSTMSEDATVRGMLVTLKDIHVLNRAPKNEWWTKSDSRKVVQENLMSIAFWMQTLPETNSDDIYLKMNARGLALTRWENIKAVLDGRVEQFDGMDGWRGNMDGRWAQALELLLPSDSYPTEEELESLPESTKGCELKSVDDKLKSSTDKLKTAYQNVFDLAVVLNLESDRFCVPQPGDMDNMSAWKELCLALECEVSYESDWADVIRKGIRTRVWMHKLEPFLYGNPYVVSMETYKTASDIFNLLTDYSALVRQGWGHNRNGNGLWAILQDREKKLPPKALPTTEKGETGFVHDYLFNETNVSYYDGLRLYAFSRLMDKDLSSGQIIKLTRALNLLDATNSDAMGATLNERQFLNIKKSIDKIFLAIQDENVYEKGVLDGFPDSAVEEESWKFNLKYCEPIFKLEAEDVPCLWGSIRFVWDGKAFSEELMGDFKKVFTENGGFVNFNRILPYVNMGDVKGRLPLPWPTPFGDKDPNCIWRLNLRSEFFRTALLRMKYPDEWREQDVMRAFLSLVEEHDNAWQYWPSPAICKYNGNYYLRKTSDKMKTAIRLCPYTDAEQKVLNVFGRRYFWVYEDLHGIYVKRNGEESSYMLMISDINKMNGEKVCVHQENSGTVVAVYVNELILA